MLETGLNHANVQLEAQLVARIEAVHGLLTATYPRLLIAFARPSGHVKLQGLSGACHREEGGKGLEARGESENMGPVTKQRQQQTPHCPRAAVQLRVRRTGALPNTPRKGERQGMFGGIWGGKGLAHGWVWVLKGIGSRRRVAHFF